MFTVIRTTSENRDFSTLVQLLDKELNARYGLLQKQYDQYNRIDLLETVVIGYEDHTPIGCGCFKEFDRNSVEIKRMMVKPEKRGSGIARLLLVELERWAAEKGFTRSVLETGVKQPEAIRFYNKLGYSRIDNYGQYIGNENSICLSKTLP